MPKQPSPTQARKEFTRLVANNKKVSLIRRTDGFLHDLSPAWANCGALDKREILGLRWQEYVVTEDLPRVLAWFRSDDTGPLIYRGVAAVGPVIVSLVKINYSTLCIAGGDSRPIQPADKKLFALLHEK
jgi:hypothetical protein